MSPRVWNHGVLTVDGDTLDYSSISYGVWTIRFDDIRVIGEYSTDHGPWENDNFLVLVPASGEWVQASVDADGNQATFVELRRRLGRLQFGLLTSSKWETRIMWPASVEGQPLFDMIPDPRPGNPLKWPAHWFFSPFEFELSTPARRALTGTT